MIFARPLSFYLIFLSGAVAAGGNLRSIAGDNKDELFFTHLKLFTAWSESHGKEYTSEELMQARMKIWLENNERIEAHNNQVPKPAYLLGHNEFSDMTHDEFSKQFKLGSYSNNEIERLAAEEKFSTKYKTMDSRLLLEGRPDEVNWVAMGGVTPVKNQGACGSCWAFSANGALEGAKFISSGELISLSEQHLLDCDKKDLGCNGGLMNNAFTFQHNAGGMCSEEDYPYKAKQGNVCNPDNCVNVPGTKVSTFYNVPAGDADALMAAVAMQPVAVAIQASQFAFQFYKSGVLTDESCGSRGNLDHGVLLVGYGTDSETNEPYWIVKNSWGETWGESGYIRMSRNTSTKWGMCAILKMASYPEVH